MDDPAPVSFKTRGGGGGLGGVAYKDRARPPPPPPPPVKIRIGYITPAFSGTQKRAELLHNPCVLRGPPKGGQNRIARGPESGRNCYVTPAFSGSPKMWTNMAHVGPVKKAPGGGP